MSTESLAVFHRYLEAKRSVDDRALNPRVWDRLRLELERASSTSEPLRVAELGAGVGTGLTRSLEWGLVPDGRTMRYDAVDVDEVALQRARARAAPNIEARFIASDLFAWVSDPRHHGLYDVVIGQALLDLLDLSRFLPAAAELARPNGLFYFPITFDGETIFEPSLDGDEEILTTYHATMDQRETDGLRAGHSRTGRRLFHQLESHGLEVLELGASDWIVSARDGVYPDDEKFFLLFILDTIERAVLQHSPSLESVVRAWATIRREQAERGDLLFIAHQLDYLARRTR